MRSPFRACVTACAVAALTVLTGCATFQADLAKVNVFANTYGPLIGKDIIMVGNILVQAECSPGLASGSQVATNVLKVIAPNSSSAQTVQNILATNVQIAAQLCPLVSAIKTSVGNVPNVAPSQVVTAPAAPAAAVALPTRS
jgi:hypothetical protein